jgi:hypothetical protein
MREPPFCLVSIAMGQLSPCARAGKTVQAHKSIRGGWCNKWRPDCQVFFRDAENSLGSVGSASSITVGKSPIHKLRPQVWSISLPVRYNGGCGKGGRFHVETKSPAVES